MRASASVNLTIDPDGLRDLLTSPGVVADLQRRGQAVADAALHRGVMVEGVVAF